jgi:superfamily II DNA or RNA helicase
MSEATYLGNKGYTIYKECLDIKDQKFIREKLTVKPYIPKSPVQPPSFCVYAEGHNKFYLPKYFGVENFGGPESIRVNDGDDISIKFKGKLRDYQEPIVDAYMKSTMNDWGGGGLLDIPCGYGKTCLALYIATVLKKKTLVIVHKSFLLNQWIERINEFIPKAKVGKIQGQIIDIEGKDIVIGMLQSLSMKNYPASMFDSFGLTIVDECHHISSEVFSRSLLKVVTKYTLGLSATMKRKDGLTDVFKMFLGEVVYKINRDTEDNVLIKRIDYKSNDEEFEETIYDYRGNPQYSSMITKLCDYNHRSEFIIQVVKKELAEKSDQQIMILGQNKSILKYLHDAIEYRNIATVGYYVGGMKEADLKISERKKIVVATYAMAAEGLDIKSLTTLMLVTPRTDVVQAVGRILRVKHERPLVIDFVDSHDVFQRQWKKRMTFYKKNKYKVIQTDNFGYIKDEWEDVPYSSKRKKKTVKEGSINKCLINLKI